MKTKYLAISNCLQIYKVEVIKETPQFIEVASSGTQRNEAFTTRRRKAAYGHGYVLVDTFIDAKRWLARHCERRIAEAESRLRLERLRYEDVMHMKESKESAE